MPAHAPLCSCQQGVCMRGKEAAEAVHWTWAGQACGACWSLPGPAMGLVVQGGQTLAAIDSPFASLYLNVYMSVRLPRPHGRMGWFRQRFALQCRDIKPRVARPLAYWLWQCVFSPQHKWKTEGTKARFQNLSRCCCCNTVAGTYHGQCFGPPAVWAGLC